ncbi:MAG: hypothetical protein IKZ88_08220 [Neisseriaceae bacterium]|nr:hypothetical protein [Neisseriaceae bacterium]
MNKRIFTFIFIILVLIGLIAAFFVYRYNKATTEYYWKDNTATQRHEKAGYFALSKFLQKQYKNTPVLYVKSMKQFKKMTDKKNNALLFVGTGWLENNRSFSNQNLDELMKWVENGNHLYIKESNYLNEKLGLKFNNFPVKKLENKDIQAACKKEYNDLQQYTSKFKGFIPKDFMQNCNTNLSIFRLPENNQPIFILETPIEELKNIGGFDIRQTPNIISYAQTADNIVTLVRVKKGKGTITVVGTYEIFSHPIEPTKTDKIHINRFDNAYFAAYLSQGKSAIYLMSPKNDKQNNKKDKLPLWLQLFIKHPLPATLFALLMILTVWQQIKRLGGTRRYNQTKERQISAHFTAQGRLITHNKEEYALLGEWQDELLQEWQRKFGTVAATRQAAVLIGKKLNVAADDIELWLHPIPQNLRAGDLLRFVRSHQQLRKKHNE